MQDRSYLFQRLPMHGRYALSGSQKNALYGVNNLQAMLSEEYMGVAVFAIIALLIPPLVFLLSRYFRTDKHDPRGEVTYECGELPIGEAQIQFHFQYYMYAIIFVAFDLVTVFVLMWALAFDDISQLAKVFVLMFLGVLLAGVAYALKKEEITWI